MTPRQPCTAKATKDLLQTTIDNLRWQRWRSTAALSLPLRKKSEPLQEHDIVVVQIALAMQRYIGRRPTTQVKVASITPVGFVIGAQCFMKWLYHTVRELPFDGLA